MFKYHFTFDLGSDRAYNIVVTADRYEAAYTVAIEAIARDLNPNGAQADLRTLYTT